MSDASTLRLYRVDQVTGSRLLRDAVVVYEVLTGDRERLDLDESWPALHVLLTGGDPPMPRDVALARDVEWDDDSPENLLMGGEATPYEDALSFARYLSPKQVRTLAELVAVPKPKDFDDDLLDYLPRGWGLDRARSELVRQAERLREWYRAAAAAGEGLLFYAA
jgi:hypothetical protein